MEPETPSRRKKTGDEPVTIDLEAVPATGEATATEDGRTGTAEAQAGTAHAPREETAAEPAENPTEEKPEPVEPARSTYEEPVRVETPPARRVPSCVVRDSANNRLILLGYSVDFTPNPGAQLPANSRRSRRIAPASAAIQPWFCPGFVASCAANSRSFSSRRASRVTLAPRPANARAVARPMPWLAPQTRACLPLRSRSMINLLGVR